LLLLLCFLVQVSTVLLSALMLGVSAAARVRTLCQLQPSVSTDEALCHCLISLPELLRQLLTSFPTLLHRTGYADAYRGWRTGVWGWVARRSPRQPLQMPRLASTATRRPRQRGR
jgi:hypothetical protein